MQLPDAIFCKLCKTEINKPDHVYTGWCEKCRRFQYEIDHVQNGKDTPEPGVNFNTLIADIHRQLRFKPSRDSLVTFELEPTSDRKTGEMRFRALAKINGRVVEYSRRRQYTPVDAFVELRQLCMGHSPEDI